MLRTSLPVFITCVSITFHLPSCDAFFFGRRQCRSDSAAEKCGFLRLGIVQHVGTPQTNSCEESCVYFESSRLDCGGCGNIDPQSPSSEFVPSPLPPDTPSPVGITAPCGIIPRPVAAPVPNEVAATINSNEPSKAPTEAPSLRPTLLPPNNTNQPTKAPTENPTIQPTQVPTKMPTQRPSFHPEYTAVSDGMSQAQQVRNITALVNSKGFRHDPDGIPWLPSSSWKTWNGIPINPCTSTKDQLKAFIFPEPGGINTMRGLRERFYQVNPYQNNSDPTVAEIENWNIEIIRHFRNLLGFNQTSHPVSNHKCTYLRAAWAEERARSNHWTSKYPGTLNSAYGPCTVPFSSNQHCGAGFLPSPSDQAVYFCPSIATTCIASPAAEGIQAVNTDIPWGIKMSLIIGSFLTSDGIGFHTGPFIGREYFGSGWYMNGASTVFRGKWSGKLNPTCP